MKNLTMEQLQEAHASAKKKMILGIVFTAVGFFFLCLAIALSSL